MRSKWEDVKAKIDDGSVGEWAELGLTDEQIASNLGIGVSTLYKYRGQHEELVEALKAGKEVVDLQVENALLKRALGYQYDEVTIEGGQETKRVTKQMAPDVTAQIFWLKNRKPGDWRDKRDVKHEGGIDIVMSGDLHDFAE